MSVEERDPSEASATDDHAADHAVRAVPESETVHGLRVALVLIGIAITIPAFLTGAELGLALGLKGVAIAIPLGSAILCTIGTLVATIAVQTRLTTYMIITVAFGRIGARIVNGVISLTLFGWFSVTAAFFGESLRDASIVLWNTALAFEAVTIVGAMLVVLTTVFGFHAIDRLALLTVPLLLAALVWLAFRVLGDASIESLAAYAGEGMALGKGVTAVIGGFIVGAVILPDYCRFAHNANQGRLAVALHFGIGYAAILFALSLIAIQSGERNFIALMSALGVGFSGLALLALATWTTNVGNLYSNALVLKTIATRPPLWLIILSAGGFGTLLAISGITDYFIDFLLVLGIALPPVAGIYIADYFLVQRDAYRDSSGVQQAAVSWTALTAWLAGSAVGYATTYTPLTLTSISACDAILIAFAVHVWGSHKTSRGSLD